MIRHTLKLLWNKKRSNFLMFLEIFFAFVILFAVFTVVSRFVRQYNTPLGFNTEQLWVANFNFDNLEIAKDTAALLEMKERLKADVLAMPEVERASFLGFITPMSNGMWQTVNDDNGFEMKTTLHWADEDYQEVAGLNLVQGRWFEEGDDQGRYKPVVISKKLYDAHFQGRNLKDSVYSIQGENKIIGVVENYKFQGDFSDEEHATFVYRPAGSMDASSLVLRIAPDTPPAFEEQLNNTIANVTKTRDFTIEHLETTRQVNARRVWIPLVSMLSICGFLVINVAMGLFGVLWFNISKRRAEVGLRRTLGASRGEISLQFIAETLAVSLAAILLGVLFAVQLPMMGVMGNWIEPSNYYIAIAAAIAVIVSVVLLCTFYPSRQASRLQPAVVLHEE